MSDFATIWDAVSGDWKMAGTQVATGGDLATAVIISVFTDRLANVDDLIPDGTANPRGWWGDSGATYRVGSRMWLLERSKKTADVLQRAKDYLAEALQWLIDDGVVAKFDIVTEFGPGPRLYANVVTFRADGTRIAQRFQWAWASLIPG